MVKKFSLSVLTSTLLLANSAGMFESGDVSGEVRGGYISIDNSLDTSNAFAVGGHLKYETGDFNGLKFGTAVYTSQGAGLNGKDKNSELFSSKNESFSLLGEAYLDYTLNAFNIKAGRQVIDTPFANTDDIRMAPNLFEGVTASYKISDDLIFVAAYLDKWAGFDAGSPEKFVNLTADKGAIATALIYTGITDTTLNLWYYDIDTLTSIAYTDAI
ncbi:MAG: hypothetical protein HXX81_05390, partial [Campylobacterales bacterium]|nr:hypothetical protein [Campylobacterales bacterium]